MAVEEWSVYAVMAAGILAGSIVKSITGFGSTIAHLCVWSIVSALTTKPTGTLQQAVVCELVFRSVTAIPYLWMTKARQTANAKLVVSISLFQTVGSPLGAWLLTVLDQKLLELILAGFLLAVLLMQYLNSYCNARKQQSIPSKQYSTIDKPYVGANDDSKQRQAELLEPLLPVTVAEHADDNFETTAGDLQTAQVAPLDEAEQTKQADVHCHEQSGIDVTANPKNVLSKPETMVCVPKPALFRSKSADMGYANTTPSYTLPDSVASLPVQIDHNASETKCQPAIPGNMTHAINSQQRSSLAAEGDQRNHYRHAPLRQLPMNRQGCELHTTHCHRHATGTCNCTDENLFWTTPTTACSFLVGGKGQSYHCSICISDSMEQAGDCEINCSHTYVTSEPDKNAKQTEETSGKAEQHGWVTTLLAGSAAGTLSGVMGGLTGMDGPPTIFMFNAIGATKDTVRGTNAVINCILMATLLTAYAYLGIFRASDWLLYTISSVSGMLGTVWGDHISSYMDQASFASMLNIMVLACALLEGASGLGWM